MVLTNVVGLVQSGEGLKSPDSEGASRLGLETLPDTAACHLTATREPHA